MSSRAVFWLIMSFLLIVAAVAALLSPPVGLIFLLLVVLGAAVLMLLKPDLWQKVKPGRQKAEKQEEKKKTKIVMALERCDTTTAATIIIDQSPFAIGRSGDCDYMVEDMPTVGRRHCRIVYKEATNNYYIEDLGSKNGTYVNSFRLAAYTPQLLKNGSMVALDRYQYLFKQVEV